MKTTITLHRDTANLADILAKETGSDRGVVIDTIANEVLENQPDLVDSLFGEVEEDDEEEEEES